MFFKKLTKLSSIVIRDFSILKPKTEDLLNFITKNLTLNPNLFTKKKIHHFGCIFNSPKISRILYYPQAQKVIIKLNASNSHQIPHFPSHKKIPNHS